MTCAVVFAYHKVGVRCLKVLVAYGIHVPLVVTHEDSPDETVWFDSVAGMAAEYGIPCTTPDDPNTPELLQRISDLDPDFLFSFYYRKMLKAPLLAVAERGALNMHGSLLPLYRGRAPVNWAVLHGERRTGATLHYMTEKPDQGDIIARTAVPILPDDTAQDVFDKVTLAAELTLYDVLPSLVDGTAPRIPQDGNAGSYFGARRPEDGIIDWSRDAATIHNLVRAVAPPYPGAFTAVGGAAARVLRTRVLDEVLPRTSMPTITAHGDRLVAHCGGGGALQILSLEIDGTPVTAAAFVQRFGKAPAVLGERPR